MADARPFDLKKLDFEAIRLQKRKRLLVWSLPAIIIVLLVSAWLIVPSILTNHAATNFEKGQYKSAVDDVSLLHIANILEPYKAYYNQGTSLSALGNQDQAVKKFETSLAYTNDHAASCRITYNLVLTMEGIGDSIVKKADFTGAINQYTTALNRLKANSDCFTDPALQKRIEQKIKAVEAARKSQGSKSGTDDQSDQSDQSPSSDQMEKIQKAEEKANAERRDQQQSENDPGYESLPDGVKPW